MKRRFAQYKRQYGQLWQVETVNSMINRRLDSVLRARQYGSQYREIVLKAITHNVMIVRLQVFYRTGQLPYFPSDGPFSCPWGDASGCRTPERETSGTVAVEGRPVRRCTGLGGSENGT
jgi:hypothetical protein